MSKDIDLSRKYKKLDHIEHILLRPERHLGSIRSARINTWYYSPSDNKVKQAVDFEYSPALIKQFDEIITNCVDHSKTPEGKGLTEIKVLVSHLNGQISVSDNGGIPVLKHPETKEWIPEMLFGSLYSGSNFNDDDPEYNNKTGGGQNGEGASLVNVFSTWFRVSTCDGKKSFNQTFENNLSVRSAPIIGTARNPGTTITWRPDYARLGLTTLDTNNMKMLCRRVFEVAACNPKLSITLNGQLIRIERFGHFVDYFGSGSAIDETDDWMVGVLPSTTGFQQYSYVNSVATSQGGPHVEYVFDQIVSAVRSDLEKRFKGVELKPAMIRAHMRLFISATINNPRFDSQTKDRMTTTISQFGTSYKVSERLINKVKPMLIKGLTEELKSLGVEADDKAVAKAFQEIDKLDFRSIPKYTPATAKGLKDRSTCVLVLTEGDSASNPILAARDPAIHGLFAVKGKFINCLNASRQVLMATAEFKYICAIMGGIKPYKPIDLKDSRYGYVMIAADADDDGQHVRGLLILLFCTFWPEFVKDGRLLVMRTPFMRCWKGKDMIEFYTHDEYEAWLVKNPSNSIRKKYLKGLGGNNTEDFKRFLQNLEQYTNRISLDPDYVKSLELGFSNKLSDNRKEWFNDVTIY